MAVVTICSDLGAQKLKSATVSTVSPSISYEVMGPDAMILVFWMLSFKPTFSLSSFTFIKNLSSSSSSTIRVVSSAYLRLLMFLPTISIVLVWDSSSPGFLMMYSACKLNKHSDKYSLDVLLFLFGTSLLFHVQFELLLPHRRTDFSRDRSDILTCQASVLWYSHLFKNFPQFAVIHAVKGFGIVNEAEINVFLQLSCFFDNPADVGNLISGSSAFSKSRLNIWNFSVHLLSKPQLENFEHYFASV